MKKFTKALLGKLKITNEKTALSGYLGNILKDECNYMHTMVSILNLITY